MKPHSVQWGGMTAKNLPSTLETDHQLKFDPTMEENERRKVKYIELKLVQEIMVWFIAA